jgi:hypothetical protein
VQYMIIVYLDKLSNPALSKWSQWFYNIGNHHLEMYILYQVPSCLNEYTYIFMHSISKSDVFYGWKPANQSSFMEVNESISFLLVDTS